MWLQASEWSSSTPHPFPCRTCRTGERVVELDLAHRTLDGPLSASSLGKLDKLRRLDLSENVLTGI